MRNTGEGLTLGLLLHWATFWSLFLIGKPSSYYLFHRVVIGLKELCICKVLFLFCFVLFEEPAQFGLINDAVADGDGGEVWPHQGVGTFPPQVKHCFSPSFPLTAFHGTDYREKKRTNHILWAFLMFLAPSGPLHQHPVIGRSP